MANDEATTTEGIVKPISMRSRLSIVLLLVVSIVAGLTAAPSSGQRASDDHWVSTKLGAIGPDLGSATNRWFGHIRSLGFDLAGELLIGYEAHSRGFVARVKSNGTVIPLVGSDQPSATSTIGPALRVYMRNAPSQIVAMDDGSLLLSNHSEVWRYTSEGNIEAWGASVLVPSACSSLPQSNILCSVTDIRKDSDGSLLVVDLSGYSIFRVSASGRLAQRLAGTGVAGTSPIVEASQGTSARLIYPKSVFAWGGRPHFADHTSVWRIESDGSLREVTSLRYVVGEPLVERVVGVTSGGLLLFRDSEKIISQSLSGSRAVLAGGGSSDPSDGLPGSQLLLGLAVPAALSGSGEIAFVPRGDTVVYRLGADRVLRHYAGRIDPGPISAGLFRNEISYIERDSDGSLLLSGGSTHAGGWRFSPAANSVAYVAGAQYAWPSIPSTSSRTLNPQRVVPGCGGEVFVHDNLSVYRISSTGTVGPFSAPDGNSRWDVPVLGGGCGFVAAVDFSDNLLRLNSDGTSENLGPIPLPPNGRWVGAQRIRSDGSGGVLVITWSGVQRYSSQGLWSVLYSGSSVLDVAPTVGGWFLISRYDVYAEQVEVDLVEISPTGAERIIVNGSPSRDGDAMVDGLASDVSLEIAIFAYDPGGFVWGIDRGRYVRSIRYSPPQSVPQAPASMTTVPRRPAGVSNTVVTVAGRTAAQSAGG